MLLICGLRGYYDSVQSVEKQEVDLNSLKKYHSKCLLEISLLREDVAYDRKKSNVDHIDADVLDTKALLPNDRAKVKPSIDSGLRVSRLDSTNQYPFADSKSTLSDLFTSDAKNSRQLLCSMGRPARKRVVAQIFDEMRVGVSGLLISDIPEALKNLGFALSPKLQAVILESASIISSEASSGAYSDKISRVAPAPGKPLQATINKEQWLTLVDKYISKGNLFVGAAEAANSSDADLDFEDEEEYVSYLLLDQLPVVAPPLPPSASPQKQSRSAATATTQQDTMRALLLKPVKETLTSRLRKVQSRIKPEITRDKMLFQKLRASDRVSSMKMMAKNRIKSILSDEDYKLYGKESFKRLEDLNSGAATLEIVDSFLKGNVASEFTYDHSVDQMSTTANISTADDLAIGAEMEEGRVDAQIAVAAVSTTPQPTSPKPTAPKASAWAADFGPAHTRTLNSRGDAPVPAPAASPTRLRNGEVIDFTSTFRATRKR